VPLLVRGVYPLSQGAVGGPSCLVKHLLRVLDRLLQLCRGVCEGLHLFGAGRRGGPGVVFEVLLAGD
jgi:hypothetical protein